MGWSPWSKRCRRGSLGVVLLVLTSGCAERARPPLPGAGRDLSPDAAAYPAADLDVLDGTFVPVDLQPAPDPRDAAGPVDLAWPDVASPPDLTPADAGTTDVLPATADGGRADLAFPPGDAGGDAASPDAATIPPGTGPPYPLVLHHGWTGFEAIGPLDYFFRVAEELADAGHTVRVTVVAPYQSSAVRGEQLADQLDQILRETGAAKVNLIAHSQGGIDARWVISGLGYGSRIASLTTISTPHRGTRLGDAYLGLVPGWSDLLTQALALLLGRAISDLGDDPDVRASLEQVAERTMIRFNQEYPDDPAVAYYSWAGRSFLDRAAELCDGAEVPNPDGVDACTPWLQATGRFVGEGLFRLRPNDGLIPVESARWGRFRGCIPADHLDEIGQIAALFPDPLSGFDHLAFYRELAAFLRLEGF
ncbi:MAG: triacylglycerol lipase [Myxococcota bacterium]|jgi:triacylglycerol esterase/lipase EstA (alpha/beta hydrolase family)|nr:triacylglycerol lipase [Myxococcota bacterium]